MPAEVTTELLMIRHAPAESRGRLAGRRDVGADCSATAVIAALQARLGGVTARVISPALRCRQTAAALWPGLALPEDARLWEQDFGAWEGRPWGDLPDLGALTPEALAAHRPPQGESFDDLCKRVAPALGDLAGQGGRVAVVAHAGVIRAALGLALGAPARGLAFQVAPLSLTRLVALPGGAWSIAEVNGGGVA